MNMKMFLMVAVMTSLSAQNLSAQNNQDSTNTDIAMTDTLKEVLVKPEDVVRYKNKVTYTISDEMRRGTFTTLGVLQHLPGFVSMGMDNEMSYKGSEKVIILKDGKEKDMSYITDLSHLRFKKVEIIDHPTGRYRNYDYVINIVSKEGYEGIEGNASVSARVLPSTPYDDYLSNAAPSGSLTYTRGKWDVATRYGYTYNAENRAHDMWRRELDGSEVQSIATGKATFMSSNRSHNYFIDTDYDINKRNSVSLKYTWMQTDGDTDTDYLMQRTKTGYTPKTYHEQAWQTNRNTDHALTAFYRLDLDNHWRIYSDFNLSHFNGENTYIYGERGDTIVRSNGNNKQTFAQFKTDVTYNGKIGTIDFGASSALRHMNFTTNQVCSTTDNDNYSVYASYTKALSDKYSLSAGTSAEYINTKTTDDAMHQFLLSFNCRANLDFTDDIYGNISYQGRTTRPNQRMMDPNRLWQDSVLYFCGNPLLKSGIAHNLTADFSLYDFELTYRLNGNSSFITQDYRQVDKHIQSSFTNANNIEHTIELFYSKSFVFKKGAMLTFQGKTAYHYKRISTNEIQRNTSYFTGFARMMLWSQKFPNNASLTWRKDDSKAIDLYSQTNSGNGGFDLSIGHNWFGGKLNVSLEYYFPIDWGVNRDIDYALNTLAYQKTASQDWFVHNRNAFRLRLTYRFAKGRQVHKKQNNQNIEYKGNWTL